MKQRTQEEIQRLDRQFDFIREIDKEKFIGRQTYLSDGVRKENDAEHAWHMAIMTILLSEYAGEEIDVLKTVTMLLLHDIVEIDAGDTYAYDEEAKMRCLTFAFTAAAALCALAATIIFPAIHMEALSINPASVKQLIVTYVQNLFGRFGLFALIYGAVAVILLALTATARSRMKRRQNI